MYLYVVFPIEQHPSFDLFQIKTLVNCSNICDSSLDFYESNFGSTLILPFISFHHWWVLARSSFCFIFPPSTSIWNNASMLGSWHLSILKKIHQIWPTLANLDSHHPHLMKMILPGFFLIVVQKSANICLGASFLTNASNPWSLGSIFLCFSSSAKST